MSIASVSSIAAVSTATAVSAATTASTTTTSNATTASTTTTSNATTAASTSTSANMTATAASTAAYPNGLHEDVLEDISGNGNHLSAFATDGGFTRMAFSNFVVTGNTGSRLSVENDSAVCCPALSTGEQGDGVTPVFSGDLKLGGSPVGALPQWTIEASIYFKGVGGWQTIVGKDGVGQATAGDVNQAPLYFQKVGDGTNEFRINFVDVAGNAHLVDSTTVAETDRWYNLAATSDGSTVRLFVNGFEESSLDISGSTDSRMVALDEAGSEGNGGTVPYGWSLFRGMYNNGHGDRVNGYVDDVRISNTALTSDQFLNTTVPALSLFVNTATGGAEIVNEASEAISFDYYRVDSPGNSLDPAGWDSLSDQGIDAIGGDPGQSWEEFDPGVVSASLLGELFVLGDTTLEPGESVSLGAAFTTTDPRDLEFNFARAGRNLERSIVRYVTGTGLRGDYNGNDTVDAADFTVWRDTLGSTTDLRADGNEDGVINQIDYNIWSGNFGKTASGTNVVPEPGSAILLLLAGGCLCVVRRRS